MLKPVPGWLAASAGALLLAFTAVRSERPAGAEPASARMSAAELFMDVYGMTRSAYVDSVESADLIEAAIEGMLYSLDPNSMLLTPDQYDDLRVQLEGSFEGVGITIGQRDGWLTVISPLEGTPAYRSGVRSGDRIVMIDSTSTEGLLNDEAVSLIRGPRGTTVTLSIQRPGVSDILVIPIVRDVIDYPSVSAYFMVAPGTGYVRLSRFSETSADEVLDAVDSLAGEGASRMILDLRGNSGGLFVPAIDVSDIFLPSGALVVTTRGQAVGEQDYYARRAVLYDGELAVLVDGGSASSAEIVAGALQDNDRAVIIGARTFGKGSVQSLSDLGEYPGLGHYAIKLTTARYYTPDGRCIDRTLRDDFLEPGAEEDWGIVPDVTIESELTDSIDAELVLSLEEEALFFSFASEYVLENDVSEDFWPDEALLDSFRVYLGEEGFEYDPAGWEPSRPYIERALLREIALRAWDMDAYYRVMAPHDDAIQGALEWFDAPEGE
ncbi:MAG: S41 family peptidase [Candidatus Fermentibacter sp.]|nr:S41 family peptidase [Candidatus Fermentibacter sp.]